MYTFAKILEPDKPIEYRVISMEQKSLYANKDHIEFGGFFRRRADAESFAIAWKARMEDLEVRLGGLFHKRESREVSNVL